MALLITHESHQPESIQTLSTNCLAMMLGRNTSPNTRPRVVAASLRRRDLSPLTGWGVPTPRMTVALNRRDWKRCPSIANGQIKQEFNSNSIAPRIVRDQFERARPSAFRNGRISEHQILFLNAIFAPTWSQYLTFAIGKFRYYSKPFSRTQAATSAWRIFGED